MSTKKTSKKVNAVAAAKDETFFDGAATVAVPPAAATVEAAKGKRVYKARSGKVATKGKHTVQTAWQAGFKAGVAFAEMGAV